MTVAALVSHLRALTAEPNIAAITIHHGHELQRWMEGKQAQGHDDTAKRASIPKQPPPQKTRRTSIKRLVRELRASGANVVIEQTQDGTTRVLCGGEECNASVDYWDEKLK